MPQDPAARLDQTIEILSKLVSFPTVSGRPTGPILDYIASLLDAHGIASQLSFDQTGQRANLFATIGPKTNGGVVLNGHTDVVPVTGQTWATDPFVLTTKADKLFGRGAVDMKGFLACMLASVPIFQTAKLDLPIHLAFSFDEEVGGLGMPVLLDAMATEPFRPSIVIVGEPTQMKLVTGHKGGFEMRTEIAGHAVHSCDPTQGVNAISVAMQLIARITEIGAKRAARPAAGSTFVPPYPTFNIGTIEGGAARNATAGWCNFNWEYRSMPGEDGASVIAEITDYAQNELLPGMREVSPDTDIRMITEVAVPPLDDRNAARAAEFVSAITGQNDRHVVSFGTDGGYFSDADYSTVICGPGDIARAHKPDEYITKGELVQGLDFMNKIAAKLSG